MKQFLFVPFILLVLFHRAACHDGVERQGITNATQSRSVFSLFSVVRFANTVCYGNNGYNGTCLTSAECAANGGTASGSCASGFGVCCTIFITTCGKTTSLNNTYWQNPGYSSSYTSAGQCSLYVKKCNSNICQLRLDFVNFVLANPDQSTTGSITQCLTDLFTVSGASNSVPTICGTNTGQHIYLDMTPSTDTFTLNMITTGTTTSRTWNILIRQIPCGTAYTAPDGCLQWFTDATATFSSFNYQFASTPAVQHLANQDYTICIRMNSGFCGICYSVCPSSLPTLSQFLISIEAATTIVDSACLTDYIQIPCATDQQSSSQLLSDGTTGCVSKICGSAFSAVTGATSPAPVYSYRKPFEVRFFTNSNDATNAEGIGFCLQYTQQPCTTTG